MPVFCALPCDLAVNFQEVVHSIRTWNADVAKRQRFAGGRTEWTAIRMRASRPKVESTGLCDRSSRPSSSPSQTPLATCDAVEALRRQRHTQCHIANQLALSPATVSRILKVRGLSLISSLEPQTPRPRYERASPGEIVHI